jgi:head-tail adaptor
LVDKLRDRVLIQALNKEPDGAGGFLAEWEDVEETWANLTPMQGGRALEFSQTVGFYPVMIKMRLTQTDVIQRQFRLVHNNRSMVIHAVINVDERNFTADLIAYYKDSDIQNPTLSGSGS